MLLKVFLGLGLLAGASAQLVNCGWLNQLNCSSYQPEPQCGTDGVTYSNMCFFSKQACNVSDLHVKLAGPCTVTTTTLAPTKAPLVNGQTAVLDFLCTVVSHKDCVPDHIEVCGTDGYTYADSCEFEKEKCTHRNLHVAKFGHC